MEDMLQMKKLLIITLVALGMIAPAGLSAPVAMADSGSAGYAFILGEEPVEGPDVAMAANGDTVAITGTGALSIHPKSANGTGEFTHRNANGDVVATGTWTVQQLQSFNGYGCEAIESFNVCGGHAVLQVVLDPGAAGGPTIPAVLQIDCLIGNPPAGAAEGVRLAVQSGPNFNKEVSGETAFIPE
jgi:hypothetical protein